MNNEYSVTLRIKIKTDLDGNIIIDPAELLEAVLKSVHKLTERRGYERNDVHLVEADCNRMRVA